jgi:hypothetical protein
MTIHDQCLIAAGGPGKLEVMPQPSNPSKLPSRLASDDLGRRSGVHRDIAPIIHENCSSCHRPGQAAPFSLMNFAQVKKRARQIVEVTGERIMPPWHADRGVVEYANDRSLSGRPDRPPPPMVRGRELPKATVPIEKSAPVFPEGWETRQSRPRGRHGGTVHGPGPGTRYLSQLRHPARSNRRQVDQRDRIQAGCARRSSTTCSTSWTPPARPARRISEDPAPGFSGFGSVVNAFPLPRRVGSRHPVLQASLRSRHEGAEGLRL